MGQGVKRVGAAMICALLMPSPGQAQNPGDLFNIFGGFVQGAMVENARREWASRPASEHACLRLQNLSAQRLASQGVGPYDPRVRAVIDDCRQSSPPSTTTATTRPVDPPRPSVQYRLNGVWLGDNARNHESYGRYSCNPSELFVDLTWCRRRDTTKQGTSIVQSVVHSDTGATLYLSKSVVPAELDAKAVNDEVQRLSQQFGEQPRRYRLSASPGQSRQAIIAVWGEARLEPLKEESLAMMRAGEHPRAGLLFDYLADERGSARAGFPVFKLAGGLGYVYGASWDDNGRGSLHIVAVNADAMRIKGPPAPEPTTQPPQSSPPIASTNNGNDGSEIIKAARLARAKSNAIGALKDASDFIKANRDSPQLVERLQQISELNSSSSSDDAGMIERKTVALQAFLNRDPAYTAWIANRNATIKSDNTRYLAEAKRILTVQKNFLIDAVAQDPVAPYSATFLDLQKQIDPAVKSSDLKNVQTLVGTIDSAIDRAGLRTSYTLAKSEAEKAASVVASDKDALADKAKGVGDRPPQ